MPGIYGRLDSQRTPERASLAMHAASSLCAYEWHTLESIAAMDGAVTLARVVPQDVPTASLPFSARAGDVIVGIDGELYDEPASGGPAAFILDRFLAEGRSCLRSLRGSFTVAIWDGRARQLIVANDRFGTRPVYWTADHGRFAFASEIKALLADPQVPRGWSGRGLAEFFSFGQFLRDDTFYESIHALPAAAWITCDGPSGAVSVDQYAALTPAAVPQDERAQLAAVEASFADAVRCRTEGAPGLGLSLSGGLDARTILGVVGDDVPLTTVSLGIPGSIDHRSAATLSRLAGRPHQALHLDTAFLARYEAHLREMVRLTDGHYLDQGIVMTTLPMYRDLGIRTLLRGHAGELLHMDKAYAFSMDDDALGAQDGGAVEQWLLSHMSGFMRGNVDGPLFKDELGDLDQQGRAALRESLADADGLEPPAQQISHVFVTERLRRETGLSMHKFRSFVDVRMPYVDERLVPVLLGLPPRLKLGDRLQAHILERHRPSFLGVVNANTGTRLRAGRWRTELSRLRLRVYSKLRVPGYEPYERLGLWLRRELHPFVTRVLLAEPLLDAGPFRPDIVRRIVDQHGRGERNHTFLLMAMLIFALGQELLGGTGSAAVPSQGSCS